MPLFWKYLLQHFFKYFMNCNFAFVGILLITRLEEIARVAAFGASLSQVSLFALYQIPYILPLVLPLSCLISAFLLFNSLSKNSELTAFRASGMSLNFILTPLLISSAFLGLFNFYLASEVATFSHLQARKMSSELAFINPLLLLQDKKLLRYQNSYVEMNSGSSKNQVEKLLLFHYNPNSDHIDCIRAHKLAFIDEYIHGQHVSLVSFLDNDNDDFSHMVIENQKSIVSKADNINHFLKRASWRLSNDHLQLKLLLARLKEEKIKWQKNTSQNYMQSIQQIYSEITRRLCLGFAMPCCTFFSSTFAIQNQRGQSKKNFYQLVGFTCLFLISFFLAKGVDSNLTLSASLYSLSLFSLVFPALIHLKKVSNGEV